MGFTFIGYSHNGIGNQYCSIQLLAALSGYFKNYNIDAVWHETSRKMQDPQNDAHNLMDTSKIDKHLNNEPVTIFDLVDFNFNNVTFFKDDLHLKDRSNVNLIDAQKHFINVTGTTEEVEAFAQGRKSICWSLEKENVMTQTLVWYSKFFFNRSLDIDSAIRRLTFKKEYVWLAKQIARDIGKFNGIQVRAMPDHHQYYKFTKDSFNEGLNKLEDNSLPLLCSVDDYNSTLVKDNDKLILIEDLILTKYLTEFKNLPIQNRITLALLSALIMIESEDFVGTPYSTYSTMIFQHRHNRVGEKWKYFPTQGKNRWIDDYNQNDKPFSWSNLQSGIVWEREWEECKLRYV